MDDHTAATKIQAAHRGYTTRKRRGRVGAVRQRLSTVGETSSSVVGAASSAHTSRSCPSGNTMDRSMSSSLSNSGACGFRVRLHAVPMERHHAATLIQAVQRGRQVRKQVKLQRAGTAPLAQRMPSKKNCKSSNSILSASASPNAPPRPGSTLKGTRRAGSSRSIRRADNDTNSNTAATKIQAVLRGRIARKKVRHKHGRSQAGARTMCRTPSRTPNRTPQATPLALSPQAFPLSPLKLGRADLAPREDVVWGRSPVASRASSRSVSPCGSPVLRTPKRTASWRSRSPYSDSSDDMDRSDRSATRTKPLGSPGNKQHRGAIDASEMLEASALLEASFNSFTSVHSAVSGGSSSRGTPQLKARRHPSKEDRKAKRRAKRGSTVSCSSYSTKSTPLRLRVPLSGDLLSPPAEATPIFEDEAASMCSATYMRHQRLHQHDQRSVSSRAHGSIDSFGSGGGTPLTPQQVPRAYPVEARRERGQGDVDDAQHATHAIVRMRLSQLRAGVDSPNEGEKVAATRIQAVHRGNAARKIAAAKRTEKENLVRHESAVKLQAVYRGSRVRATTRRPAPSANRTPTHTPAPYEAPRVSRKGILEMRRQQKTFNAKREIQADYRGYKSHVYTMVRQRDGATNIQRVWRGYRVRWALMRGKTPAWIMRMQGVEWGGGFERRGTRPPMRGPGGLAMMLPRQGTELELIKVSETWQNATVDDERRAAAKIQALVRGRQTRRRMQPLFVRHRAAMKIQALYRGRRTREQEQLWRDTAMQMCNTDLLALKYGSSLVDSQNSSQQRGDGDRPGGGRGAGGTGRRRTARRRGTREPVPHGDKGARSHTQRCIERTVGQRPPSTPSMGTPGSSTKSPTTPSLGEKSFSERCSERAAALRRKSHWRSEADLATVRIQALYRGHIARQRAQRERAKRRRRQSQAATKIQAVHRGNCARREFEDRRRAKAAFDQDQRTRAAHRIQAVYRGNAGRATARARRDEKHRRAATKIQALHRGNEARRRVAFLKEVQVVCHPADDGEDEVDAPSEAGHAHTPTGSTPSVAPSRSVGTNTSASASTTTSPASRAPPTPTRDQGVQPSPPCTPRRVQRPPMTPDTALVCLQAFARCVVARGRAQHARRLQETTRGGVVAMRLLWALRARDHKVVTAASSDNHTATGGPCTPLGDIGALLTSPDARPQCATIAVHNAYSAKRGDTMLVSRRMLDQPPGGGGDDYHDAGCVGYAYATWRPGLVPLDVYYSPARQDSLPVVDRATRFTARQSRGFGAPYTFHHRVGYVLASMPREVDPASTGGDGGGGIIFRAPAVPVVAMLTPRPTPEPGTSVASATTTRNSVVSPTPGDTPATTAAASSMSAPSPTPPPARKGGRPRPLAGGAARRPVPPHRGVGGRAGKRGCPTGRLRDGTGGVVLGGRSRSVPHVGGGGGRGKAWDRDGDGDGEVIIQRAGPQCHNAVAILPRQEAAVATLPTTAVTSTAGLPGGVVVVSQARRVKLTPEQQARMTMRLHDAPAEQERRRRAIVERMAKALTDRRRHPNKYGLSLAAERSNVQRMYYDARGREADTAVYLQDKYLQEPPRVMLSVEAEEDFIERLGVVEEWLDYRKRQRISDLPPPGPPGGFHARSHGWLQQHAMEMHQNVRADLRTPIPPKDAPPGSEGATAENPFSALAAGSHFRSLDGQRMSSKPPSPK